jgi:LytS/YehU family sensor histidine kinase
VAAALFWSAVTPCVVWLGRRFPVEPPGRRARATAAHVAAAAAVVAADGALSAGLARHLGLAPGSTYLQHVLRYAFLNIVNYLGVLMFALYLAKRVRAAELEAQLARANLRALQAQLRPHFLFNALNTVAGLVRGDERRAATEMLAGLGDLLRATLKADGAHEVPLRDELDLVERYLAIERARFEDRLEVAVSVARGARDALVPSLILQPLVENALRHGIAPSRAGGRVAIVAEREDSVLRLQVRNTGAAGGAAEAGEGVGLSNTRARLERLYGGAQRFRLERGAEGAVATIELPFRPAAGGGR